MLPFYLRFLMILTEASLRPNRNGFGDPFSGRQIIKVVSRRILTGLNSTRCNLGTCFHFKAGGRWSLRCGIPKLFQPQPRASESWIRRELFKVPSITYY